MSLHASKPPEILGSQSGIPDKNPKSGILAKSGIWLFPNSFSELFVSLRISDASFRNPDAILNNHVISIPYTGFQISEKAPLKGWVASPARGEVHHPPLGKFLGPKSLPDERSDDGGRYRQASTAVVFHPSSQPEKETTHG